MRIFRHHVELQLVALGLIEAALFLTSFYVGYFARYANADLIATELMAHGAPAFSYTAVMMASLLSIGLYERAAVGDMRTVAIRMLAAFALGFVLLAVIVYLVRPLDIWRSALLIAMPTSFVAVLLVRRIFLWLVDRDAFRRRILVLGDQEGIAALQALEAKLGLPPFRIALTLPLSVERDRTNDDRWLSTLCRTEAVDEVVVAARERRGRLPMRALLRCRLGGLRVSEYHDFCERETGRVDLDRLEPSWLVFNEGFGQGKLDATAKRAFDIALAATFLVLVAPVLALAALAIKLEDGGPIFYRQTRMGRNGEPFEILKLRSMRVDAERHGPRWAAIQDARITRVGRLLRRTRIDELPQLVNILKGEMSFVGPRPERPVFVEQITESLPYFPERHRVRPGLAGWAQLNYPYGADLADARAKLEYDLYYVKNWSLFLDLLILAQTLRVIVWGNGVR